MIAPAIVQAQTTSDSDTSADQGIALEEIVVTALKRASDVQKTPVALDVVNGDVLSRNGVNNLAAIANIAPSLNFGSANGIYTTVTIRGVSSQDTTELGDPAVAFNVDGEYINRPLNLAATLFDIDRVEVLRGPQGTLYGRNATAGAINIITRRPSDTFSAYVSGEAGDYSRWGAQGAVNMPLGDTFAVRVAGVYSQRDGFTRHELNRETDDEDIKAGRVRMLFNPGKFSLLLTGEVIETGGGGPGTKGIIVTGPARTLPTNLAVDIGDRENFPVGINPRLDTRQNDVRAEASYDFGAVVLTYVGGYRVTKFTQFQNIQGTPIHLSDFDAAGRYETLGNELRLASGASARINWQVGYYDFDENQNDLATVYQGVTGAFAPRDSVFRLQFQYPDITSKSRAFFGESTIPLGDKLAFTAGIRNTRDEKTRIGTQLTLDLATFNATQGQTVRYNPSNVGGLTESTRTNWNAVLNYEVNDDSMVYAKASTGYKAGGFTTINQYGPEDLKAYEVGTKNRFIDGKLQVNVAIFDYDYQDQQISSFVTNSAGVTAASTQNAASSKEYGAEFDLTSLFTRDDRLRFTADYLHAEFESFNAAVTSFSGATIPANLTGNTQPFSPEWTFSLSFDHTFRAAWGNITAGVISAYKTEYFLAATNYAAERQPGYSKTDFTLGYSAPSGQFDVTAYVRNVEDKRTLRLASFANSAGSDLFRYQFGDPRTFGIKATYRFE